MSSRLKERGGAGGKIIACKTSKTLPLHNRQDKPRSHSIPLAAAQKELPRLISASRSSIPRLDHHGKENPRPISAGRPSMACCSTGNDKPRPLSAGRATVARSDNPLPKHAEKPVAAVLRSTSSLSRGKVADFHGDAITRISSFGERRSFSGFRAFDKELAAKAQLGKNPGVKSEKYVNLMRGVTDGCKSKGCLGAKPQRSYYESLKKVGRKAEEPYIGPSDSQNSVCKDFSGPNMEPVDRIGSNEVGGLESHGEKVFLVEVKHIDKCGHGDETVGSDIDEVRKARSSMTIDVKPFDNSENKGTLDLVSKSLCKTGEVCVDNTLVHMEKNCLNSHPDDNANASNDFGNSQGELANTSLIRVHHRKEAVQLDIEAVKAKGNDGLGSVKDACTANRYQSNLHEKLALLEGKVQKIALEIKQTKDMLDKNKPAKSGLVLSDIQKKILGVEKAVDNIKDGAKFEILSSYSGKFDDCVISNLTEIPRNSLPYIKSSEHEKLEARFFPHHKLMRERISSVISGEQIKCCKLAYSRMNGAQNISDGFTDENPIALEFLASLREEQPKPKKFDVNVQLTNGMANKMQPENTSSGQCDASSMIRGQQQEVALESNEKLEEIGTPENNPPSMSCVATEDSTIYQLSEIGQKVSTGGWFVSGGEAVLLAHDDNSCSYYDISNSEVKSEYKAPADFPSNLWGDCWLIRAPGIDGCSGQYVVAASAGNALESGFCSWDFYTKDVKAFLVVGGKDNSFSGSSSRTGFTSMARSSLRTSSLLESQSCWCRPCGPLLISTFSRQKVVNAYDIRDGDLVMTWEVNNPVAEMEYSSPLQWRSKGKVIIAEREAITLWDVNSLNPQPTLTVPFVGKKFYSLHVNNTDAEIGAGVRQRASSTEVEGNDGVLCTQDGVNVFDFRIPSGVGLKISRHGGDGLSIFSRSDSIFLGSTEGRLSARSSSPRSHIEHFSLRKGSLITTYMMPGFNSHYHHSSITQVWGNSDFVMGICGMGLFVFDALNDSGDTDVVKETIGPDDLFRPTFDYMESRALVISRDRPAFWKYLL
ncbi:hypothetical protein KFK09_003315 [Dendrobium nobile]|uniref:At4g14310 8-bladed propeller domain-containing protein n=1 Tax=Dendrobium nobile TaxID=94219 RepID=A0A8T3C2S8_DENNO|nr:hypothetical protein KFK09_003315 [Dendrobium nobile]